MRKKPMLTIAIPTFNGERFIRETLESIVTQFDNEKVYSNVSIYISDNASQDRTADIVNEYMLKYKNIKYHKNEKNLGADQNFDLAVRNSDGKFVWILSDDDYLNPNSIIRVLDIISNDDKLSNIYSNYATIDEKTKGFIKDKAINIKEDVKCCDGNTFFKTTEFTSSLVSTVIIKKSCWESINTAKYYGCSYIHFAVLLETLIDKKSYIISDSLFVQRAVKQEADKDWSSGTKILNVSMDLAKLFKNMKDIGYSDDIAEYVNRKMKTQNLKLIVILKANSIYIDRIVIEKMKSVYGCYFSFWVFDMLLIKFPNRIFAFIKNIKYKI